MPSRRAVIAVSINACWNFVNFRAGLIAALRKEGYEVVAIAPADAASEELAGLGVSHLPIAMDVSGHSPARDLTLMWRYYQLLRQLRPDAYLGYTAKPNIYGSLAAQALGIPVINNVSGLGTAFIRGGFLGRLVSNLYRVAFRRSRIVFFQNADDRGLFVSRRLVRPAAARLLPGSGIDLCRFQPVPLPSQGRDAVFLLVGRMLWDKGIGEYVEAARLLRRTHPTARFQILGFLKAQNATAVPAEQVTAWQREGVIEFLGDSPDVRPFIAAADCVVLPSYREGLPRSLLEAAAMARPLVATDVPGCRDVVQHGVNGYLCTVRDASSLAEAMERVLALEPSAREAMGNRGRALVEARFDERLVIESYLQAVAEAIAGTSGHRGDPDL